MRYWVTWKWYRNACLNGICSDEIEVNEPVTSPEVVRRAVATQLGDQIENESEVSEVLSWSVLEAPNEPEPIEKDIRFFKRGDKWYADVKGHTMEENEMVFGSDNVLETLAEGGNEVTITVSTSHDPKSIMHFKIKEHDDYGATYTETDTGSEIWICNVTHDVLGEHPDDIYVLEIK